MNNKIASLDTETKNDKGRCEPIPFIATSTNTQLESNLFDLSLEQEFTKLNEFCIDSSIKKVFHNATYDIYVLSNIGIKCVPPYEDTMLMATLVNENFDSKKLKVLAKVHLNELCLEAEQLSKIKAKYKRELKKSLAGSNDSESESESNDELDDFDYSCIPSDVLYPYAIKDAIYTLKLYYLFRKTVYERYKDLYEFELSLIPIVVEMTQHGFNIDRNFIKKMIDEYSAEVNILCKEMESYLLDRSIYVTGEVTRKTEAGIVSQAEKVGIENVLDVQYTDRYVLIYNKPFNAGSSPHLRIVIEKLGITVTKFTGKTEQISTDKEALASIPKDSQNYKFIELLHRWRFLTKQLSTYYVPLYTKYTSDSNSIAHFIFYQSGAKSGRFTAKLVQTIPRQDEVEDERFIRHIRKAFIPRHKRVLVAIDYDQIEMRIFAHFSRCKKLIDDINNGYDPHLGTAWSLFGRDFVESQTKDNKKNLRRIAKTINFGIIYGMGKNKLARSLGIPLKEAFDILDIYHKTYPVKQHIAEQTAILYKSGYVTIDANSPLMRFKRDYHVPQELAYKAVNIRIQGMAAYCMKYGIKRSYDWIKQQKLDIPLICTIHDELFFEVWEQDYCIDIVKSLTTQMEDRISFDVPILASPKASSISWGDAQDIKI